jgi:prepilin-type N-terminal cleavage/methylation domain-containing protein
MRLRRSAGTLLRVARVRDARGFSLLEVLVATTIMVVALVSLAQVLALATALNASAGRTTVAATLASQKLESLRGLSWDSLQQQVGRSVDYLDRSGLAIDAEAAAFTRESIVQPLADDPPNLVGIRVIVRGAREAVELGTTITRHAP